MVFKLCPSYVAPSRFKTSQVVDDFKRNVLISLKFGVRNAIKATNHRTVHTTFENSISSDRLHCKKLGL